MSGGVAFSAMDVRFSQFEILTASGCAFLCLLLICVFNVATGVEEDLAARVTREVQQPELFWVSADAQGQKIVLAGAASDAQAKRRAGLAAEEVWGVTEVANGITIVGDAGVCQRQIDDLLQDQRVSFRSGSAELADASYRTLTTLARLARGCGVRLEIATHTDSRGDAEINQQLSQRRADVVRNYLVRSGVAAGQLVARGYGESQPISANASGAGRKANRRVEFRVLGAAA